MTVNVTEPYPDGTDRYANLATLGINGKGVKRPGLTRQIASRTVVTAEDVSNQDDQTQKLAEG